MDIKENYPHSLQSEQTILGQMLQHDAASIVAEGTTKDWFFSMENQVIFESIRQVFDAGQDISELSVLPVLQSNMAKERMDSDVAMSMMMALPIVYTSTWVAALRNVRNKFLQRNMIRATRSMLEALQMPLASAEDIKVAIQEPMNDISTLTLADDDKTAKEEINEFIEQKMKELRGEEDRIPEEYRVFTGMKHLEETLGHIDRRRKDNNIIIAAPSSRGKSALKRQIIVHNLFKHKDWVIVAFLLESSKEDWWHNTACSYAKIDTRQPLNTVAGEKQKLYVKCLDMLKEETDSRLFLFDSPESLSGVTTRCREIAAKCGKIDILCVDYIQILDGNGKGNSRESEVAAFSGGIQRLQKSLRCVAFSGTQLNDDGKARESRAIFNDATIFWRLERPERDSRGQTQEEGQPSYYQTVKQEKCRNGILTTVGIDFQVTHQTMVDNF
jgi:replicative DNA helicase|tara:strand:+ start:3043 stop:4371 length:1329 start_codon:yes stop_codon:yes gene_type:complete